MKKNHNLFLVLILLGAVSITYLLVHKKTRHYPLLSLTPWSAIGGCGVGGAGDKGGAALEWMGQGVSGGYYDFEAMPSTSINANETYGGMIETQTFTLPLTFYAKLSPVNLSLRIPLKAVSFEEGNFATAGFGDMSFSVNKGLGAYNQYNLQLSLGLPTGRYDIHDKVHHIMDNSGQLGSGVFTGTLQLTRSFDKDWGIIMVGTSYSAGLMYLKAVDWEYDSSLVRVVASKREFASARKGTFSWQNDVLTENSDSFGFKAIMGLKGERVFHSFHLLGSIPLQGTNDYASNISYSRIDSFLVFQGSPGPNVWNEQEARTFLDTATTVNGAGETVKIYQNVQFANAELNTATGETRYWYADRQLTHYKVWPSITLGYGQEISNDDIPVFWGVSLPFEFDKEAGYGFTGFALQVGIKSVIF